ncbi:MAG TPA: nuclear transport factor 2 family protein [Pseudaminobacter sp.]|nr:nuclear transport factor 2 family protein [Pseudaminobacter sp.]
MALRHNPDLIRSFEEELFKQSIRGSPEAVDKLLADGFVELFRSGRVYDKEEVIRGLATEGTGTMRTLTARDFDIKSLADDVVLLTYRSLRKGENGKGLHSLRSSIWKLIDGRWQMVFHQGTPTASLAQ